MNQLRLNNRNLARSSQLLGLGIASISLLSGAMPRQLLATEVNLDNLIETRELEKNSQSVNSSEIVADISGAPNLKFIQTKSVLEIDSLDKHSTAIDIPNPPNFVKLSQSLTPSINRENADGSLSNRATDLQLKSDTNSVKDLKQEPLLAQEIDLEYLCQSFPLNSRCTGYKSPAQSYSQERLRQKLRAVSARSQRKSGEFSKAGFYGSISGDARFLNETNVEPIDVNLDFDTGFGVNAALGYRFRNNLRVEGQFSYGSNEIGEIGLPGIAPVTTTVTNNVTIPAVPLTLASPISTPIGITIPNVGTIPAGTTIPAGVVLNSGPPITTASDINVGTFTVPAGTNLSFIPGLTTIGGTPQATIPETTIVTTPEVLPTTVEASGKLATLSGLLNLYYDFPLSPSFEPYIGAGIGVSRASAENVVITSPGTVLNFRLDGSSTILVYQLMAGVAYYFSPKTALTLGYRYFNVAQQSFDSEEIGEVRADGLGIHNIEVGLRFLF